jgi:asparagine N-glycosylation enzyme membrane subunit Stt3
MPIDQKYSRNRKRSKKIGTYKPEQSEDKSGKRVLSTENPIVTWMKKDWTVIVGLIIIFFISLFLRSYFYYPVATEDGFLLSGNDPFYHKRVIDYAQQYFVHIKADPLLDYPLIGQNPRPPVFDWSNAISGLFLSPLFNGDINAATWYIFLFSPALWGALTIFPVYFLTRDMFGRKPAMISAFFMGVMASHIERSPLGFSDHDAMVVFFVVTAIFFLAKAIGQLKHKYWVQDWKNPAEITSGISEFFSQNPAPIGYSILSGLSISTVALIWKGFPYVLVIFLGSFLVLSIVNHLRKFDSTGIFFCMYIAFFTGLAVSLPWYALFNIGTWIQPLYMLMAFLIIGLAFIPTRDLPWIMVIPTFLITMAVVMTILSQIQPTTVDALFTGGGYFIKSKLYSTIAEAQAPDTSRLAVSYGPVTFYLTLIGLVLAAIQIPKHWKMDFFLIIVWCALAIYMAMSAVRFMFNATPVFAILSGWITWRIVEYLDPTLRAFKKIEIRFVYLYIGILTFFVFTLGYWWLYLEQSNYLFFQIILGFGLFGIFVAIFTGWIMLKYNMIVGILIYISYIMIWIWYSFDALINQTFGTHEILWDKFPWELFAFGLAIIAMVFVPMIIFIYYRYSISGSKIDLKHVAIALFFVFLVFTPNLIFAIDASIPYEKKSEYDPAGKTLGSFGHSFPSDYWQSGMDWLSQQDTEFVEGDRPAFISWWDYGFWALYLGEHPTVADNFQAGYQLAGSFIASTNETQAIALFAVRIMEGDFENKPKFEFSPEVEKIIIKYLDDPESDEHPNYDRIVYLYKIERKDKSEKQALIKEVESHPNKYGKLTDIKIKNAKYAAVRQMLISIGKEKVVDLLGELETVTGNCIRYFAVDTRLFPFSAQNTGIFYAPIKLADKDIADYIKYYALVDVRDNREAKWRSYSDRPVPTEEIEDEIDLRDIVETHGGQNVRIKDYVIQYTDDFYNSMFYKCYIGYTYKDIFGQEQTNQQESRGTYGAEIPGLFGSLQNSQQSPPMQGWNMTHFRLVYRTAYWTPYNETELGRLKDKDKGWEAMSEIEAIKRIQALLSDGKDNNDNGEIDERGEGGTWSPAYTGGGVYFLKYYHGAIVNGKVVTDSEAATPLQGIRVTVRDDFGIPHDTVFTDEHGNYNLTVPFGHVVITTSKDGYPESEQEAMEGRILLTEQTKLNETVIEISDQQAMRKTSNYIIKEDLKIPIGSLKGKIYFDLDDDDIYDASNDKLSTNGIVFLDAKEKKYNLSYNTNEFDENGNYKLTDVVPGTYKLSTFINGHLIEHPDDIVVTVDALDVEQDLNIKQATIIGNATFTNNTSFPPQNVTIQLRDLLNNSIMEYVLNNNNSFIFPELLPGEYILSVDKPGIKYFSNNITLAQGDSETIEIPLIPLVPVNGIVYNDLNDNGFDENDLVVSAHVEFINIDNFDLSSVLVSNSTGGFRGNITQGNYTIYIHYTMGKEDFVHVSSLWITNNSEIKIILPLEPGFWINGTVLKQKNTPVPSAFVKFIITDNAGQITLPLPTNSEGLYRGFLPYRKYKIEIDHLTSGNITYLYFNHTSYLRQDIERIAQGLDQDVDIEQQNVSRTKSRQIEGIPKITKDIHLYEGASRLWGYVYWDHNKDGIYYISNETEDSNTPSSPLPTPEPPGVENVNDRLTFFPNDFAGPENELVVGAQLVFYHDDDEIIAYTNENGYYSVFIPPGNSTISIGDPRFQPLDETIPEDDLSLFMPFNVSYQPIGIQRNFSVTPRANKITGFTWFDLEGKNEFDENNIVTNVPIKFTLLSPLHKNMTNTSTEVISDENTGEFSAKLTPGEYIVEIDYDINPIIKYSHSRLLSVPFNNPQLPSDSNLGLNKVIFANFSFKTNSFNLNHSNVENLSIELIIENGHSLKPLPIEINDSYYKGYILPKKYTVWVEYLHKESSNDDGIKYVYFGLINITDKNHTFELTLQQATNVTMVGFVDTDNSGNFTIFEEQPEKFNLTLTESSGGIFHLRYENGSLHRKLMPGKSYKISINDTQIQPATHGSRIVRYISEFEFEIPETETELFIELPLTKYYNFSGKIYYDENENGKPENFELYSDLPIHFTGPMDFIVISNSSGRFSKFVLEGEYFVTVDHPKFLSEPKIYSYNVSLDDTFFDIEMLPKRILVHGVTYFDADDDAIFTPGMAANDGDRKLKNVMISFTRSVFLDEVPDPADPEPPKPEPLEESAEKTKSDSTTGKFEIYLPPGEYNINAYITTGTGITYCSLDMRIIELADSHEFNISMYEGQLVEGNVYYRDSNLTEVHELDSIDTGTGIRFENLDTAGAKIVLYRGNGSLDSLYLPHGNYSVSSELLSEEFGLSMEYTMTETVWIRPEVRWYTFELNKENDYSFELSIVGETEIELRTADRHLNVFSLKLENIGNIYNTIDIFARDVPSGWYVHFNKNTIPLDFAGKFKRETINVDITIPVEANAENDINIEAEARGNPQQYRESLTLKIKTPAIYGFDIDYGIDKDIGMEYNDTLTFSADITKTGNAADDLYFKFYNVPSTWNVSILESEGGGTAEPEVEYQTDIQAYLLKIPQEVSTKNLTIQVRSPDILNSTMNDQLNLLINAWSGNRPELEYTEQIDISIRQPDIIIKNIKFKNEDLKEGTNVTVQAVIENHYRFIESVNLSLYINDVLVENITINNLEEYHPGDPKRTVDFYWQVARYNLTDNRGRSFKFKIIANGDEAIIESNFENNRFIIRQLIGEKPEPEEFNWRPIIAVLSLLIIFVAIYAIYRWRKRI